MLSYVWQLGNQPGGAPSKPSDIQTIVRAIVQARGFSSEHDIDLFLNPDYGRDVHDPFLFASMRMVVDRIYKAIQRSERIVVFADYDADGVCSAAVMVSALEALGARDIEVYIPHREDEGYGLNMGAIQKFIASDTKLLITLDCGTTNVEEIASAKSAGVDVIVIDHHHVPEELPGAYALLNPKMPGESYPYHDLASVGMAFKVAQALFKDRVSGFPEERERWLLAEKWLLDLVAIATVTDLVPLTGENRVLLKYGLIVLNKTMRPGLRALIEECGEINSAITAETIGFRIGPRLNAAGRMGHAIDAYNLLMAKNDVEATTLAKTLSDANRARQVLTEKVTAAANAELEENKNDRVLVAIGNGWPIGLVGLVASRLLERHNRPVLVISRTSRGLIGSGRSVPDFNIIEAMHTVPDLFVKFGGHAQACGFTLPDDAAADELRLRLNTLAAVQFSEGVRAPDLELAGVLELRHVQLNLFSELQKLEPCGMGNMRPIFLFSKLTVVHFAAVGVDKKHLKLMLSDHDGQIVTAIGFKLGAWGERLTLGDHIDIAAEIIKNEWRGSNDLQLRVVDLRRTLS
ncbi:MAG: single-stranded-DNA-specific exonuclease RecJ [Patescibacteria group bacterium]|jgi:single-stranded-DNA-specific exonuclease